MIFSWESERDKKHSMMTQRRASPRGTCWCRVKYFGEVGYIHCHGLNISLPLLFLMRMVTDGPRGAVLSIMPNLVLITAASCLANISSLFWASRILILCKGEQSIWLRSLLLDSSVVVSGCYIRFALV